MGETLNQGRLSLQPSTTGTHAASPSTKGKVVSGHGYKGPKKGLQNLIEIEMQRMVLAHEIGQKIDEILHGSSDPTKGGDGITTSRSVKASGKSLTARSSGSKDRSLSDTTLLQSMVARHIDTKALVSAVYVCDFGNVISGMCGPPPNHQQHSPNHNNHY